MEQALQPISLAGSQLGDVRHVCAFFTNDDEEYRVLLPFIREGLSSETRPYTSSIPRHARTICNV